MSHKQRQIDPCHILQLRESQSELQATQAQTEQIVARLANVTLEGFREVNAKLMHWWILRSALMRI
jgi:hypothetical protein